MKVSVKDIRFKKAIFLISLLICIISSLSHSEDVQKVYILYINIFRNNSVELLDFSVDYGEPSDLFDLESNYTLKIISVDNKLLFDKPLPVYFIAYATEGAYNTEEDYHGIIYINSTILYLKLPYFPNGKKINIYHLNAIIFSLDISEYICDSDGRCEEFETEYICEKDCIKKTTIPTTSKNGVEIQIPIYIILIIIIFLVIIVFLLKRRKENIAVDQYAISDRGI